MWHVTEYRDDSIIFEIESLHLDQGFPGNAKFYIIYRITGSNSFEIEYNAVSDMDTVINMTNHSYFNLNGEGSGSIVNHKTVIHAVSFTPLRAGAIPTGEVRAVDKTPMDFRKIKRIGDDINSEYEQIKIAGGYDHNWVIDHPDSQNLAECVEVYGDKTGIAMKISSDYPGIQMYTGNYIGNVKGKHGHIYAPRDGVCFEPQYFPDAVNRPEFESSVCKAGQKFDKKIKYVFFNEKYC